MRRADNESVQQLDDWAISLRQGWDGGRLCIPIPNRDRDAKFDVNGIAEEKGGHRAVRSDRVRNASPGRIVLTWTNPCSPT